MAKKSNRLAGFRSPDSPNAILKTGSVFEKAGAVKSLSAANPTAKQFDWRSKGLAFEVRDQGDWNACCSMALTAMTEARRELAGKTSPRLMGAFLHNCLAGITDRLDPLDTEVAAKLAEVTGIKPGQSDGPPLSANQCALSGTDPVKISGGNYTSPGVAACNALVANGPMLYEIYVPRDFGDLGKHTIEALVNNDNSVLHCMLLVGYDWPRSATFLNSFGGGWGNDGFATLDLESIGFKFIRPFEVAL